jgi:elongation factor Ts
MASVTITPKDVSELRARTGAGMMDCKRALEESGGDMEKAVELLRKKGIAKAEKREGKSASQGVVMIETSADGREGAMVELNCETDFVARTEDFQALARALASHVAAHAQPGVNAGSVEEQVFTAGRTVAQEMKQVSGKVGEVVALKRYARFKPTDGVIGYYLHHNGMVGVLVELAGGTDEKALEAAKDVALHISFADPIGINPEDVPAEMIERERRIAEEQVAQEGKPENIRGKIVDGKIRKFVAERTLVEQPFVRDDKTTVGQVLKKAGTGLTVTRFARFKVGAA